ncbi:hypothetical protein Y027_5718 [Burkholderia pseudomallei TSV5]|nr:hypothetical protein X947_4318 [Burkholderia pseudomallei MSHR7334]KGX49540.1 hypothetical protein Y027_5718 [Burkholderia pseudomallei TSV5]
MIVIEPSRVDQRDIRRAVLRDDLLAAVPRVVRQLGKARACDGQRHDVVDANGHGRSRVAGLPPADERMNRSVASAYRPRRRDGTQPFGQRDERLAVGGRVRRDEVIAGVARQPQVERRAKAARCELVRDEQRRHQRDAHARVRGRRQHREQLVARAAHRAQIVVEALRAKPVAPRVRARRQVQQRQIEQRVARDAPPVRAQQRRAADGQHVAFEEQQPPLRAGPQCVAEVDRRVERRIAEEERPGAHRQVHRDVGPQRAELRQARNQPLARERRHDRELERRADAALRHQLERVALDALEVAPHERRIMAAVRRQHDPFLDPQEQRDAEPLLERRDLAADRALRERELVGRAGKAFVAGRRFEDLQRREVRNAFAHRCSSDRRIAVGEFLE